MLCSTVFNEFIKYGQSVVADDLCYYGPLISNSMNDFFLSFKNILKENEQNEEVLVIESQNDCQLPVVSIYNRTNLFTGGC